MHFCLVCFFVGPGIDWTNCLGFSPWDNLKPHKTTVEYFPFGFTFGCFVLLLSEKLELFKMLHLIVCVTSFVVQGSLKKKRKRKRVWKNILGHFWPLPYCIDVVSILNMLMQTLLSSMLLSSGAKMLIALNHNQKHFYISQFFRHLMEVFTPERSGTVVHLL